MGKVSPLKHAMSSVGYSGTAPKGVIALSPKGAKSSNQPASKRNGGNGVRRTEDTKPGKWTGRLVKKSDDKSSGQSLPINRGNDNKKRYTPTPQPDQFSNNGPRPTTFIC